MKNFAAFAIALPSLAVALPSLALGRPVLEKHGGVVVDRSAAMIEVRGAGAPDLRAPTAEVGRFRAERSARIDAGKRLKAALPSLMGAKMASACRESASAAIDLAVAEAAAASIDWGSDGSVTLALRVPVARLAPPQKADAGSVREVIVIDRSAAPQLFVSDGRAGETACDGLRPGPLLFDTLAEVRASSAGLAALEVTDGAVPENARVAAIARSRGEAR